MKAETKDISMLERDILEWDIPEEVLAVLLKDRTTGRNLIWATDDYAGRGKGFAASDEIQIGQIIDKNNPVIRPRVDVGFRRVSRHQEVGVRDVCKGVSMMKTGMVSFATIAKRSINHDRADSWKIEYAQS